MSGIDKARALYLARTRALKKKVEEEASSNLVVSGSSIQGGDIAVPSAVEKTPARKILKRPSVLEVVGPAAKKMKAEGKTPVHIIKDVSDDEEEVLPEEILRTRGVPTEIGGAISSGSGLAPSGLTPSATGVVGYSLTQFQAGRGWLGDPSKGPAPLEALNIFSLSPDKELMAAEDDEKLLGATQEAFGQLGARLMRLVERASWNMRQVETERSGCAKEKKGKEEAEGRLEKVEKEIERLQEDLRKEKEASVVRVDEMSKLREDLEVSHGVAESFRVEMERMQGLVTKKDEELLKRMRELEEVNKTLEKVEKEANITYQQCVEAYKESKDFRDEVDAAAGSFHAEGFQDCLNFVGEGNVVNLALHTVEKYHAVFFGEHQADIQAGAGVEEGNAGSDRLEIGGVLLTFEEQLNSGGAVDPEVLRNPEAAASQGIGTSFKAEAVLGSLEEAKDSGVGVTPEGEVNQGADTAQAILGKEE